jgi:3-oxoacyl-[acyl-carrier protein] reductase
MADCGDQTQVEEMAASAIKKFGRIDVLIHNAAIRPGAPFLEMSDTDLDQVMRVNTYAAVWLSRAALPGMIEAGWGRIINFTGMNAQRGSGGRPHVTMSKHAVVGLTKALAREFGPKGVTSNVISPGTFPGEGDNAAHGSLDKLLADVPVGRLGESDDIAALVAYLCGPHGGFVNGQLLQVNGGVEM